MRTASTYLALILCVLLPQISQANDVELVLRFEERVSMEKLADDVTNVNSPRYQSFYSPEEIRTIYSHQYPELATAAITGPEASGEQLQYSFVRAIGTKG